MFRDFSRKIVPLIYDDSFQLDKFNTQISFLNQRCESQTTFAPTSKILKRGNVANLIHQEIEEFQSYMKRKETKEEIKEYLRTIDQENLMKEDILNGVYIKSSRDMREFPQSLNNEYVSRTGIVKNSSRTNLNKAENSKKPVSVRTSSKAGIREKKPPAPLGNREKINIPCAVPYSNQSLNA